MDNTEVVIANITEQNLDEIVKLDTEVMACSRRDFFTKRLKRQNENPAAFISLGAHINGQLTGLLLCHMLRGEFGDSEAIAVLDTLDVAPAQQGKGIGHQLLTQLLAEVKTRGGRELRTVAEWNRPGLIDFFSANGFALAPRQVLQRQTREVTF